MADRKRNRRKNEKDEQQKCSKEEYTIAKFMRFNAPVRDAKFVPVGNFVKCFIASKVVDALMDSKWSKGSVPGDIQFTDRKSCVAFCDRLLSKGLFHRAMKIKSKKKKKEEDIDEKKKKKDKGKKEIESEKTSDKEESKKDDDKKKEDEKKKDEEKKKKEKKLRLDMHDDQRFIDGDEIYVWIYDPIPAKTFIIGCLMVLGAAALCLFPLWPGEMRIGVYYISLVGASFVGFILFLVFLRFVLFCILWFVTLGKLHFWLLPNLTEDVGFVDSFRPLYTSKIYKPTDKDSEKEKKNIKKSKKEKKENEKEETETGDDLEKDDDQEFEMVDRDDVAFTEGGEEESADEEERGSQGEDYEEEEEEEDEVEEDTETKKDK